MCLTGSRHETKSLRFFFEFRHEEILEEMKMNITSFNGQIVELHQLCKEIPQQMIRASTRVEFEQFPAT